MSIIHRYWIMMRYFLVNCCKQKHYRLIEDISLYSPTQITLESVRIKFKNSNEKMESKKKHHGYLTFVSEQL